MADDNNVSRWIDQVKDGDSVAVNAGAPANEPSHWRGTLQTNLP